MSAIWKLLDNKNQIAEHDNHFSDQNSQVVQLDVKVIKQEQKFNDKFSTQDTIIVASETHKLKEQLSKHAEYNRNETCQMKEQLSKQVVKVEKGKIESI